MAQATYVQVMPLLLGHEGGYVNHPRDPGGETNMGITRRVYRAYRKSKGLGDQSVRLIARAEVEEIYRHQYWDVIRGDALPAGVDYAVFDAAVNSGPGRGARWLQKAAGAAADGVVGIMTITAARDYAAGPAALVRRVCAIRLGFLRALTNWRTFGKGWARRVAEVEREGVALAITVASAPATADVVKEVARDQVDAMVDAEDKAKSAGEAATGGGAAAAGSGGSAVGVDQLDQVVQVLLAIGFLAACIYVAVMLWRRHVQCARAAVYAEPYTPPNTTEDKS